MISNNLKIVAKTIVPSERPNDPSDAPASYEEKFGEVINPRKEKEAAKETSREVIRNQAEKKAMKAENKRRSLDYLSDVSSLVMESFGKRKNREKK